MDATAVDYGRDVKAVADIARATGVNIIGTAGFNKSFLWSALSLLICRNSLADMIPTKHGWSAPVWKLLRIL